MSKFDRDHYPHTNQQHLNHWLKQADKQRGFPQDDEFSMMQGDLHGGCCNLDIWYTSQFVQNETTNVCRGIRAHYQLEKTPILPGTMTFTVYVGTEAVQVGYVTQSGQVNFDKKGKPEFYAEEGSINVVTGEMFLRFNKEVADSRLVVSYEYDMERDHIDQ